MCGGGSETSGGRRGAGAAGSGGSRRGGQPAGRLWRKSAASAASALDLRRGEGRRGVAEDGQRQDRPFAVGDLVDDIKLMIETYPCMEAMTREEMKGASDHKLIERCERVARVRGLAMNGGDSRSADRAFDEETAIREELRKHDPAA